MQPSNNTGVFPVSDLAPAAILVDLLNWVAAGHAPGETWSATATAWWPSWAEEHGVDAGTDSGGWTLVGARLWSAVDVAMRTGQAIELPSAQPTPLQDAREDGPSHGAADGEKRAPGARAAQERPIYGPRPDWPLFERARAAGVWFPSRASRAAELYFQFGYTVADVALLEEIDVEAARTRIKRVRRRIDYFLLRQGEEPKRRPHALRRRPRIRSATQGRLHG